MLYLFQRHSPLLPFLAGAALRLFWLDRLSFWLDEAFSVWLAQQPLTSILDFRDDPHPPLYYLILHFWLRASDSEGWTRLLSALSGSLTVPAVYGIGRLAHGHRVGLAAAWLLAVSPWHIWYSQEARMYAAVTLMGALSVLSGLCWMQTGRWLFLAAYALATLLGLYLDYSMLLLWPLAAVALALKDRDALGIRGGLLWAGAQGCIAAGYLPQWGLLARRASGFLSPEHLAARFGGLAGLLAPGLAGLALLAFAAVLSWLWLRKERPQFALRAAALALLLLLLGSMAAMLVPGGMTAKRIFALSVPFLCLGGAWAIERLSWSALGLPRLVALGLLALLTMFFVLPKEPWREVVAHLHGAAQPNDIVLLEAPWMTVPFDYYDQSTTARAGVEPGDLGPPLAERLKAYQRAWLVLASAEMVDPGGQVLEWFTARYPLQQHRDYYHIQVRQFDTRGY